MGGFAFFVFLVLLPLAADAGLQKSDWELDGFFRNNSGFWTENWDTSLNNDPLATCRNWFRLNLNGKLSPSFKLKAEILAIYEPEYPRERHGIDGITPITANYYNYFDFRELRLDWRMARGHDLLIGRQIVNWGESISARIGDVVNPMDMRFDLGFTNLEDTRMPIWMIRGLHQFATKTRSISLDWIFSPYLEPDRYRVSRIPSNIGHTNTDGSFIPGPRFGAMPDSLSNMEKESGQQAYFGGLGFLLPAENIGLPVIGAPFNNMWQFYDAGTASLLFTGAYNPAAWADGQYFMFAPTAGLTTDYPD